MAASFSRLARAGYRASAAVATKNIAGERYIYIYVRSKH